MGETCGLKLPHPDHVIPGGTCGTCEKLKRKENRYTKAMSDYNRWKNDPKFQASAEKAAAELRQLYNEMDELRKERERKYMNVGSNRRTQANGHQANGHQVNGHQTNGYHANGHQVNGNGYHANGHQVNGH